MHQVLIVTRPIAVVLMLGALTGCGVEATSRAGDGIPTPTLSPSANVLESARGWALALAQSAGDVAPGKIVAVTTTHRVATKLVALGSEPVTDTDDPVVLAVMHGHFDADAVLSGPAGHKPLPASDEIFVAFNATTGEVEMLRMMDTSRDGEPNLNGIGPVTTLH